MARYALVIGIGEYKPPITNLRKPVTDAEAVAQVLNQHGDFQEIKLLNKSKDVTGANLGQALQMFLQQQAVKNEALIYFTGHGVTVSDSLGEQEAYLGTSDCAIDQEGNQIVAQKSGISLASFNNLIRKSDLSSLVVLLDCCHSGHFLERNLIEQTLTAFSSRKDYYLITACRGFEQAYARRSENHSIFTGAMLKGLSAENAGYDGQVSGDRLFDFIATELRGSGQEPIRMGWGRAITLVKYQPKQTTVVINETCPYRGLEPFYKEQARFFFGREKVIQLLMEKLAQANFVPIIGASGSGKSSVVRAGLIPQLEKNGWQVLDPIKPGIEPLAKLTGAFERFFQRAREIQQLYDFIHNYPEGLRLLIERLSGCERFLLVVDQFEEVFTLCAKEEERGRFIELLTNCPAGERLAIVITLRADFLERCLDYPSLTELIQNQAVYMPPLLGADLEQAITEPANLQGYRFEDGLLGEIMQDVGKEQGCLPLLQFALTELWEKRDTQQHQLTVEQYRAMAGVIGALNRHAEDIYNSFTQQEQEWVKRIFLKLVRTGEGEKDTRQRQPKGKLLAIGGDKSTANPTPPVTPLPASREGFFDYEQIGHDTNAVLDDLIEGRLLVSGEEGVDLAHEALMEGWQRFAQWRQENRELRRLRDRLEDALREWQKNPQDENLMMGGLLAQVREKWLELKPDLDGAAREFYQRSEIREQELVNILSRGQRAKAQAQELKQVLLDLQKTQAELIQSEKMAGLGQLLSGLAHQMNGPAGFIFGNIFILREYAQDLTRLVELYQQHYPVPPVAIAAEIELLDLDFLKADFLKLLSSMQGGAERIREIVNSLRNFSPMTEVEMKPVNIHKGIDNALLILQHRLKHKDGHAGIYLIQDYGDLPLVECYPGQMNQVFMNIVSNAIDALESQAEQPTITISTEILETNLISMVVIRIQDNGSGMTEEVKKRIFDPFFSTKPVGKGTGLGLSISYQIIVEKHKGTIKVNSEPGKGAEFVITLPVKQS